MRFHRLNAGWNAEPNAPELAVREEGCELVARFRPNAYQFEALDEVAWLCLRFDNVSRYRRTSINDHAWYTGRCRFSGYFAFCVE
jgi:hypothetical protein